MKEALLYQKLDNNKVRCNLCEHRCVIHPGKAGICKVRENIDGILYTEVYGRAIALHIDPVEKNRCIIFIPGQKHIPLQHRGATFIVFFARIGIFHN
ncbi:hypothetical protein ES703_29218 [subsurface metagenome]